jgi:hypothetical protein
MVTIMKPVAVMIAAMMVTSAAVAQQPTFPLLQDGPGRVAFQSSGYEECLKVQRAAPQNASLSTPELGAYCLCAGRALADTITGAEYEALALGKFPDSFREKQQRAASICISRMSTSQQSSQASQLEVAIQNMCRNEFNPEDTGYAATLIRENYCGCYAGAVTSSAREAMSPKDAEDYCSQHMVPKGYPD